jgi:hypothetical protein
MSFVHYTLVGHFDPRTVARDRGKTCSRPLDPDRVARLIAEYPAEIKRWIRLADGYAACTWAGPMGELGDQIRELAYRLAREEGCLAVEQGRQVTYPPEAARRQMEGVESDPERLDNWEAATRRRAEWILRKAPG